MWSQNEKSVEPERMVMWESLESAFSLSVLTDIFSR